jgi:uncharacterized protein YecE (DUF72 family)
MSHLYAGTSGFAYAAWKPEFYPKEVPAKNFLAHYATRLNGVEINYTFRRLAAVATLEKWVQATPATFRFAIKAHQRITHFQRLKNVEEFTEAFFKSIDPLRATRRLGPVLFQLPPQFKCDVDLLGSFLRQLPSDVRCAFEFRNESWLADPVYRLLEDHKAALCLAESEKFQAPDVITADFVYCRLRMPEYSPEDRRVIAAKVSKLLQDGKDVFVFFKHEDTPAGAFYAEELLKTVNS